MGSYCDLEFGSKCVLWSKNSVDPVMMSIFTAHDRNYRYEKISQVFPEDYEKEDDTPYAVCEYVSNVSIIKKRLDILGFSLNECEKSLSKYIKSELERYSEYVNEHEEGDILYELYKSHTLALESANVSSFISAYKSMFEKTEHLVDAGDQFRKSGGLLGYISDNNDEYALGIPIGDIRYAFRILLECFDDQDSVVLNVNDLIGGGWYEFDDDLVEIAREELTENYHYDSKIIILTEGSSDKAILEKSLGILYPQYSPYYTFMDFGIAKGAGGASALVSVVKAFVGAGIRNRIIAIFDNDTAARVARKALATVPLPDNIRVMSYPRYDCLESYPTIGPSGKHNLDVNNVAGSIELYLCKQALEISGEVSPVQWKGYDQSLSCYQGEVLDKNQIQRQFYDIVEKVEENPDLLSDYDWVGLRLIFDNVFRAFEVTNT
jgi:hypothetical protein